MLSLSELVRIYVCLTPTDMRKSFDSLAALVREGLGYDPLSGHLFVFRSRRGDRIKLLWWDRDGLTLYYRRLEEGTFRFPTAADSQTRSIEVSAQELSPETSQQLDWRPSTLFVTVHVRKKYARKQQLPESGLTLAEQNVAVAKKPPEAIPGSLAGPGLMAQVIVSKGTDHLPLYRLEGIFARQGVKLSRPLLEGFQVWLQAEAPKLLPKSAARGAMDYTLSNWTALSVYPDDGWLDIDNNEAENALRGLCLGRKNWLFFGSDRGGRAAAVHFSLLASCKRHGHDPWIYYRDVLTRLPAMLPGASEEDLLALLPHRWQPA